MYHCEHILLFYAQPTTSYPTKNYMIAANISQFYHILSTRYSDTVDSTFLIFNDFCKNNDCSYIFNSSDEKKNCPHIHPLVVPTPRSFSTELPILPNPYKYSLTSLCIYTINIV